SAHQPSAARRHWDSPDSTRMTKKDLSCVHITSSATKPAMRAGEGSKAAMSADSLPTAELPSPLRWRGVGVRSPYLTYGWITAPSSQVATYTARPGNAAI